MNLFKNILIFLFGAIDVSYSLKTTQVTLPIQDRIAILKSKIAKQLKEKSSNHGEHRMAKWEEVIKVNEDVEYEDRENEPITPISEKDPRKKRNRYKLKEIKTTRDLGQNFRNEKYFDTKIPQRNKEHNSGKALGRNSGVKEKLSENTLKPIVHKKVKKTKITDVFYRRAFSDKLVHSWTHCQDLITPFLTGHKTNMTTSTRVTYDNYVVIRLIQLLTEDVKDHTKDDIHSILYQISNLQLRLFQWDVAAIKLLLNVINREKIKRHSFKTVKEGLKKIFANWKLDFSSRINVLVKQARIFRPPCVSITENEGSTKTSKTIRYTKSVQPKKQCVKADPDYDNCKKNS